MIDPQVAFDKLAQFETADEIAEYFQQEGIKGLSMIPYSCPIAQYMSRHTGLLHFVGNRHITVLDLNTEIFDMTDPMQDFVSNFDMGCYWNIQQKLPEA